MRYGLPPITIHDRYAPSAVRALGEQVPYSVAEYGLPSLWSATGAGEGVYVGIVDTGIDTEHVNGPELRTAVEAAQDFTGSPHGAGDRHGHGTHVAGIVAARQNAVGTVGVAPQAKVLVAKALGDNGSGSDQSVANAVHWLCDMEAHVINLSLGSPQLSQLIREAVRRAHREGRLVFAAAGNDGAADGVDYPGALRETVAVGAVDRSRQLARFSDRGPQVDLVAPGVRIFSTYQNGGYATLSGTSMATPWMAGLAACRLSAEMLVSVDGKPWTRNTADFLKLLALPGAVDDLGQGGRDPEYGRGLPVPAKLLAVDPPGGDTPPPQDKPADDWRELVFPLPFDREFVARFPVEHDGDRGAFIYSRAKRWAA